MSDANVFSPGIAALLHLCDSMFPTGGYAHSDGLEAATDCGAIASGDDLRAWVATVLDETLAATEGPAVVHAWRACRDGSWAELRTLDDELHAMRPSAAAREASRGVGTRLLKTWIQVHRGAAPTALPAPVLASEWTLPVAFAVAAASAGSSAGTTVEAYMYTRLAAVTSAAMRLMRLGQLEAHTVLGEGIARIPQIAARLLAEPVRASAFTPLIDLATMRQQYVGTRLFRS